MDFRDPLMVPLLALAFVLPFGLLVWWLVRRRQHQRREMLQRMASGGAVLDDDNGGHGEADGRRYTFRHFPGAKNAPPSLTVEVPCAAGAVFKVRREQGFDRFFKRMGLASEIQTGDPLFDRDYYLLLDDRPLAARWLGEERQRERVNELFRLGATELALEKGALRAVWRPFRAGEEKDPELVPATARALAAVAGFLEASGVAARRGGGGVNGGGFVAYSVAFGALVFGLIAALLASELYPLLDTFDMVVAALPYTLPPLFLFVWLSIPLLRGRADSHIHWMVAAGTALPGIPLAGVAGLALLNGWLDTGSVREVVTPITHKHVSRSSKNTNYYLTLESWRGGGEETLRVGGRLYASARAGEDRLRLELRDGNYGYVWVGGYDLVKPGKEAVASSTRQSGPDEEARRHYARGSTLGRQGEYGAALEEMRRALELDPHYLDAYLYLDWLLAREGRWGEIITAWDRLIALEPGNARAWHERGGSHFHKGELEQAVADTRHACDLGRTEACADLERHYGR